MIADSAARLRALDVSRSFIVQAPAGSGKTELLIQRYLKLLETVETPDAVVAITFTRKAAGEMRSRVIEALRAAQRGVEPEAEHERLTFQIARNVLEHERKLGWDLLRNPARLRIETIDALCAAITRRMPWLSRFGAMPEISEKAEDLYREAARNTLSSSGELGTRGSHIFCCIWTTIFNGRASSSARCWRSAINGCGTSEPTFARNWKSRSQRLILDELAQLRDAFPDDVAAEVALLCEFDHFPEARMEDLSKLGKGRGSAAYQKWRVCASE